jgi:hypothetical protein
MKTLIKKILKGKVVLLFFIISSSLYFLMLFVTIPHLNKITSGIRILDMMPAGYDSDYVVQLMEALGETGRHYYLYTQIPIDLVFPFFFAISNSLIMAWFLKKLDKLDTRWFYVCYLPLFAGFFDYAENFSIISILNNYPEIGENSVLFSNLFSVMKSSLTTIALSVLVIILLVFLFKRIFNRN